MVHIWSTRSVREPESEHTMQYLKQIKSVYHFRIRVPADLQPLLQKSELKKSLKTTDMKLAARLASLYATQALQLFAELQSRHSMSKLPFLNAHQMIVNRFDFIDGTRKTTFELDKDNLQAELDLLIEKNLISNTPTLQAPTLESSPAPTTPTTQPALLLSQAIEHYIAEMDATGKWKPAYVKDQRVLFAMLLEMLPDKPVVAITRQDATSVLNQLKKRPKHSKSGTNAEPISEKTRSLHLSKISSMFNWLLADRKIEVNPFRGFAQKPKTSVKDQRESFDREDLTALFADPIWTAQEYNKPSEFWIPLLALYTGARLTELCQLQRADIVVIDEIHCLNITDESDTMQKFVKTQSSTRLIPIHSALIRYGFLKFVDTCKDRLFPECRLFRDKYSHDYSKWFSKLKTKRLKDPAKKSFHSFRHLLTTELKLQGIAPELRAELLGHSYEAEGIKADMTVNRYSKNYPPAMLLKALELLNFDTELANVQTYTPTTRRNPKC